MPPIPFAAFASDCWDLYRGPRYSPATTRKIDQIFIELGKLGVRSTADLTTQLVTDYVSERMLRVSVNAVRGEMTYLKALIHYAYDEGFVPSIPHWKRSQPRRAPTTRPMIHSIDELRRVLDYLRARTGTWDGARVYTLASFLLHTGCRRNETLLGHLDDLDLDTGLYEVVARTRLKTERSARLVPLPPDLVEDLRRWMPQAASVWLFPNLSRTGPWVSGAPGRRPTERLRAAGDAVGVAGLTCQSMRHCYATWGRRRFGIDSLTMRDVLGHTSERTHWDYYLGDEERHALVAAVRGVSYRPNPA